MKATRLLHLILGTCLSLSIAVPVNAHCDTMDGPVVKDARLAMQTRDVTRVLKWVRPKDEGEIRKLFDQVIAARSQGEPAKTLAERYFFESLVRMHRAGEGAPYTGLKPAGTVEPVIAASDRALDEGNVDVLADRIARHIAEGIRQRFEKALEARRHAAGSVREGRDYVAAYVAFTHYVEGVHTAATGSAHGHSESEATESDHTPHNAVHESPSGAERHR